MKIPTIWVRRCLGSLFPFASKKQIQAQKKEKKSPPPVGNVGICAGSSHTTAPLPPFETITARFGGSLKTAREELKGFFQCSWNLCRMVPMRLDAKSHSASAEETAT